MKKLLALLLLLSLLTGCGAAQKEPEPTPTPLPTPEPSRMAENEEITVFWQEEPYTGVFSGVIDKEQPLSGQFIAPELVFSGTFVNDRIDSGTLEGEGIFAAFEGEACIGRYTGTVSGGLLTGEGSFVGRTESGVPMTYTGSFGGGLANGTGLLTYADESRFDLTGTFTDGMHTPEGIDLLRSYGSRMPYFKVTEEQEEFLDRYPEIWDADNSHFGFFDTSLPLLTEAEYPLYQLFRDRGTPAAWMEEFAMRVVDWRHVRLNARGDVFTVVTLSSNDYYENVVSLVIPGAMEGLRYNLRLHAAALPLSFTTYVTVQGIERDCLVELAAEVYY